MDDIVSPSAMERDYRQSVIDLPGHGADDREEESGAPDRAPPLTAARDEALAGGGQGPAEEETVVPAPSARRAQPGRFFLLAGAAMFVVAGGAAGYTYRGPLMFAVHRFEVDHGLLKTGQSATVHLPRPIQPAQRLASNATNGSTLHPAALQAPAPEPTPGVPKPNASAAIAKSPGIRDHPNSAAAEIDALKGKPAPAASALPAVPVSAASPLVKPSPGPLAHALPPADVALGSANAPPSRTGTASKPPSVAAAAPSAGLSPAANGGPTAAAQPDRHVQPASATPANAAPAPKPASTAPGDTATLTGVPHPVGTAQKLVAAPMTPRAQVDVLSLVSQLGMVVAELRTQNDQLSSEVRAMHTDMTTQLAAFDRRLTFDQAHDRLALAGAAHPDVHPPAGRHTGVFPAPKGHRADHLKPASYRIEAASPSLAILSHDGQSLEVSVGSNVPGVGQVVAIRQYGPDWRVVTTHGVIR